MSEAIRTAMLVVGAGPCGLAVGVAAAEHGVGCILVDRGPVVHALERFPLGMTWFSTPELLEIGGLPFVTAGDKPSRAEALKYYRRVTSHFGLDVRQYEEVVGVERSAGGSLFEVDVRHASGDAIRYEADFVVIATGTFDHPNLLGVEGEALAKVSHYFREPHRYHDQDLLVIGGSNSAVESALACWRAGARVTMLHRGSGFGGGVKPWVLPDIGGRLAAGEITMHWNHEVERIEPRRVLVRRARGSGAVGRTDGAGRTWLPNDFVLAMTGFHPNPDFLESLGVPLDPATAVPAHDPLTMETTVPGLYIAGVIAAGKDGNRIFVENGRLHGQRILQHLGTPAETPDR